MYRLAALLLVSLGLLLAALGGSAAAIEGVAVDAVDSTGGAVAVPPAPDPPATEPPAYIDDSPPPPMERPAPEPQPEPVGVPEQPPAPVSTQQQAPAPVSTQEQAPAPVSTPERAPNPVSIPELPVPVSFPELGPISGPVNIHVDIRINSPGDNGDVIQVIGGDVIVRVPELEVLAERALPRGHPFLGTSPELGLHAPPAAQTDLVPPQPQQQPKPKSKPEPASQPAPKRPPTAPAMRSAERTVLAPALSAASFEVAAPARRSAPIARSQPPPPERERSTRIDVPFDDLPQLLVQSAGTASSPGGSGGLVLLLAALAGALTLLRPHFRGGVVAGHHKLLSQLGSSRLERPG